MPDWYRKFYPGDVGGHIQFDKEELIRKGTNICLTGPWAASRLFCRTVWEEISFSPSSSLDEAEYLIRYFGIGHLKNKNPQVLSGGEQQLVLICAYLSSDPDLILLDESFAPLSKDKSDLLAELLLKKHNRGKTILMVEHRLPPLLTGHVVHHVMMADKIQKSRIQYSIGVRLNPGTESLLSVKNLEVEIEDGTLFKYKDFSLPGSGIMHLNGPVGSGEKHTDSCIDRSA